MENLIFLICFCIFGLVFSITMLVVSYIFGYKSDDINKSSTYECGIQVESFECVKFNIKYYNYLICFLIFDSILVLLYPLVITSVEYSKSHYHFIVFFLLEILFALVYLIKSKYIGVIK